MRTFENHVEAMIDDLRDSIRNSPQLVPGASENFGKTFGLRADLAKCQLYLQKEWSSKRPTADRPDVWLQLRSPMRDSLEDRIKSIALQMRSFSNEPPNTHPILEATQYVLLLMDVIPLKGHELSDSTLGQVFDVLSDYVEMATTFMLGPEQPLED